MGKRYTPIAHLFILAIFLVFLSIPSILEEAIPDIVFKQTKEVVSIYDDFKGVCRISNSMEQFFRNKLKHTSLSGDTPKKLNSLRSVDFNGFFKAYGDSIIPFPRQTLFKIPFLQKYQHSNCNMLISLMRKWKYFQIKHE